jgi:hypothetical protein
MDRRPPCNSHKPYGWTRRPICSLFVPVMREQLFTLIPLAPEPGTSAPGLTLAEAFMRLMAVAGRDYMFFRTGWVMHMVSPRRPPDEPEFESSLAVDAQARADIMRQVCEHGLGLFRMVPDEQLHQERAALGLAPQDAIQSGYRKVG